MDVLIIFAFLAGIVTVLSPCILPILPIVLSSSVGTDKSKPYGVITGFILSFTFFTLFLTSLVRSFGLSADFLRNLAVVIIGVFGLVMVVPKLQVAFEKFASKFTQLAPSVNQNSGFLSGLAIGLSIGVIWTPCVGPILASVISLAIIGEVTLSSVFITLAYAVGTSIPMFFIIMGGSRLLRKIPLKKVQSIFGVLMVLTAIGIFFNYDRKFQSFILNKFPNYGAGLTNIEDTDIVKNELKKEDVIFTEEPIEHPNTDVKALPKLGEAPELIQGGEWFNSEPLTLEKLKGKVVIVDFWTYSCINCQRTLPYLRDWYEKYEDEGLVIIGVHAPEFEFEKNPANVLEAIKDFELTYPVMQDNEFKTWRAYNNRYWPAKYIIDAKGIVRYTHFGEGGYDETESVIQQLLKETGAVKVSNKINNPDYDIYSRTPELYLGYSRIEHFTSMKDLKTDEIATYQKPSTINANEFAWDGDVLISKEYSNPQKGAVMTLNFESKEVFLVMRAKEGQSQVKVTVDGEVAFLGVDVDASGVVTIDADTLYKLVNLDKPGRHTLQLEFLDDNTEVYAFTFG